MLSVLDVITKYSSFCPVKCYEIEEYGLHRHVNVIEIEIFVRLNAFIYSKQKCDVL